MQLIIVKEFDKNIIIIKIWLISKLHVTVQVIFQLSSDIDNITHVPWKAAVLNCLNKRFIEA